MSKIGSVSGLRAMFESGNKEDTPERGRSPGLSAGTESPRPLSKIRTNFVAVVEKDGRVGLKRDPSSDSVLSNSKKTYDDTDIPSATASRSQSAQDNPPSFTDRLQQQSKPFQMDPIPQSPLHDSPKPSQNATFAQRTPPAPGRVASGSDDNKTTGPAHAEASTTTSKATKSDQGQNLNGKTAVERDKSKAATKASPAKEGAKTDNAKTDAKGPKALSVTTTKSSSRPAKSPVATKTPTSPAKGPKLPAKTPEKRTLDPQKSATPKLTPKAATKATGSGSAKDSGAKTSSVTKKPPTVQISPSDSLDRGVGFVKPKPKSPTRPVALPAGLTTHTAASATRTGTGRSSSSRQSGSYQNPESRSPSRTSTTTGGTLRRQSSTINRPRPSIGPPPKTAAVDHPVTKREKPVDEGFLARMMRPTQASSSKTHEKVAASPPRKNPGVSNVTKRPVANKDTVAGAVKKTVAKTDALVKKASSRPIVAKQPSEPEDKLAPQKGAVSKTTSKSKSQGVGAKAGDKPEAAKAPEPAPQAAPAPETKPELEPEPKPEPVPQVKTLEPKTDEPRVVPVEASRVDPVTAEASQTSQSAVVLENESPKPETAEATQLADPVEISPRDDVPASTASAPVDNEASVEPPPAAFDGTLAETSSEKEPTEPKTPVDVHDVQEPTAIIEGSPEEEVKPTHELGLERGEEATTVVAN
ncbi:hypothetical protein MGG_11185 [Pyricularia oryzae 70-15]|uniref:Mucin-7 n=1 Tax=Pyricularia oryzae (strain 70-15 / ATCC MYA-4617 / FGSC 8958) TaxID=242507 RepID=G4MTI5_PYRO7|nr:uncharacterized protein MGG_11185 [Pyricularia oryzae 70-15]EHA54736.1 hypothetical protein MGG_11185 [Pyricularia oryzae 70-15]KAI7917891.1 hypothetical protein M9X92_007161 [Pyricularia oryzae]KAI7919513.1 hypothetical protein M0657_007048 [Pyricularia oryzae]